MKILLVRPYNKESFTVVPPIGLGYLATALRRDGFKVEILDCVKEKVELDVFVKLIKRKKPDLVGVSVFSSDLAVTREYLQEVKNLYPQVITTIGGPHPSALPVACFEYCGDCLDYVFVGEAEIGFSQLVQKLNKTKSLASNILKTIPGLVWRKGIKYIQNKPQFPMDLDALGNPSWDLIKPETYPHAPLGGFARRFPVAYILTSRSCPFSCTFCAAKKTHGSIFRRRSLKHVMREVRYLIKQRGIKELHILDDNFTLNQDFVKDFCREVLREKLNFSWNCSNGIRLDKVNEEMLTLMKKAGCYSVSVGVESGSDRILKHMRKNLTKEQIRIQVELIRKVGLEITGLFILGYPAETKKDILETIAFAKLLKLNKATFSTFVPLPGSEMWEYLKKAGRLNTEKFGEHSYYRTDSNYMKTVSQDEFSALQKKAFMEFYLQPRAFLTFAREISSPKHLLALLRRVFYYFKLWFLPKLATSGLR